MKVEIDGNKYIPEYEALTIINFTGEVLKSSELDNESLYAACQHILVAAGFLKKELPTYEQFEQMSLKEKDTLLFVSRAWR